MAVVHAETAAGKADRESWQQCCSQVQPGLLPGNTELSSPEVLRNARSPWMDTPGGPGQPKAPKIPEISASAVPIMPPGTGFAQHRRLRRSAIAAETNAPRGTSHPAGSGKL